MGATVTGSTLKVESLTKRFGKRAVVQGVSFSVSSGEVVGILGPNGAGKTTTFYMVVGLLSPDSGSIELDGNSITSLPLSKRAKLGLGYLAQEPSVFRKLSVEANIAAVLENTDLSKTKQNEILEELIQKFGLQKIRKSYGIQLSGGERRRVEIARALALRPKFILLDEPFAGIDPLAVHEIQKVILSLKGEELGVLITDHNVRETLGICDRALVLQEGRVGVQGSPTEIAANPTAREVYLGENFRL